jgi:hypothetical protein
VQWKTSTSTMKLDLLSNLHQFFIVRKRIFVAGKLSTNNFLSFSKKKLWFFFCFHLKQGWKGEECYILCAVVVLKFTEVEDYFLGPLNRALKFTMSSASISPAMNTFYFWLVYDVCCDLDRPEFKNVSSLSFYF